MRGFVPTPATVVKQMVALLFGGRDLSPEEVVLDAGCGEGAFVDGIVDWCEHRQVHLPRVTAVELDPQRLRLAADRHQRRGIEFENRDFLTADDRKFDYIISNPPYVPITELEEREKKKFRNRYVSARGRFDLYLLFIEQSLRLLAPGGRAVFITPEKYLYTWSGKPLRRLMAARRVASIRLLDEKTFPGFSTYPTITVVEQEAPGVTQVTLRSGVEKDVRLPVDGSSWTPMIWGNASLVESSSTLGDLARRISCGIATGADSVFVHKEGELDGAVQKYAQPTVSGRELESWEQTLSPRSVMLMPYDKNGQLLPEDGRSALIRYLSEAERRGRLLRRSCVPAKPWYAFHETPPPDIWEPKIMWKDLATEPTFYWDPDGNLVPRHSVYYMVPKEDIDVPGLLAYLNSRQASDWFAAHCQRAANGYLRLQSRVVRMLPVPQELTSFRSNARSAGGER